MPLDVPFELMRHTRTHLHFVELPLEICACGRRRKLRG